MRDMLETIFRRSTNITVSTTLGALLIGVNIVAMLLTLSTVQVYVYYQRNQTDRRLMKYLIFALWILDISNYVLVMHTVYSWAVKDFMNPAALTNVDKILGFSVSFSSMSDLIVTLVYAHRIWKFGGASVVVRAIVVAIVSGAFATMTGGIGISIISCKAITYPEFSQSYMWLWDATLGARVAVDVLIASTTCIMLYRCRRHAKRTKSVIHLVIVYTVNTCVLTTICTVLDIITYAIFPDTFIAFALGCFIPHLMFNSLLAILNSRQTMRNTVDCANMQPISLSGATLPQVAGHGHRLEDEEKAQDRSNARAADITDHSYEASVLSTIAGDI